MDNKYRNSKEYFLIYAELIAAARYRGTVTYQELADLIGLPLQGNYMGTEIGHYLGEISRNEVEQGGRPMLSVIAVRTSGQLGDGFFDLARQLGRLHGAGEVEQRRFMQAEQDAVYETWHRSFAKVAKA